MKEEELIDAKIGQGTIVIAKTEARSQISEPTWNQLFTNRMDDYNGDMLGRMFAHLDKRDVISFALGMADPRLTPALPFDKLAEYTKISTNKNALLQTPVAGDLELRRNLCELLAEEDITCTTEQMMLLSGSQQGIDIAARILIQPGDIVFAEAPTYFLALQSFQAAGARIIEVPTDKNGIRTDNLEQLLKRYQPKCIYTIPNYQNPSSCCMSLDRRKKLVELAQRHDFIILEDDAYAGFGYEEKELPCLFQLDQKGYVVYLRTFSKSVYSGIRLGFMVAHKNIIAQACMVRQSMDIHPNSISQWLMNEFIISGNYKLHLKNIKNEYKEKMNIMHQTLLRHAPEQMLWTKPAGGYYYWCRLPGDVKASELLMQCIKEGVAFMPGIPFFHHDKEDEYIRLNFTVPSIQQIQTGIPVICSNIRKLMRTKDQESVISRNEYYPVY